MHDFADCLYADFLTRANKEYQELKVSELLPLLFDFEAFISLLKQSGSGKSKSSSSRVSGRVQYHFFVAYGASVFPRCNQSRGSHIQSAIAASRKCSVGRGRRFWKTVADAHGNI